jgi:hypothetical protein
MHSAPRRGYLETQDGKQFSDEMLARLTATFIDDVYRFKRELISNKIPSIEASTGIWFNRRMVRDACKSVKCSISGKRGGGNPKLSDKSSPFPSQSQDATQSLEARSQISLKDTLKGDSRCSPDKSFSRPTIEQCIENGIKIDLPARECESFFYHYESNGWFVGKSPMKSWKGAMQTWKRSPFRSTTAFSIGNIDVRGNPLHPDAIRAKDRYASGEMIGDDGVQELMKTESQVAHDRH